MKNIKLFSIILIMSFTSTSQTLKPRLIQEGKDTLFAFTVIQSKIIAGKLSNGIYCDSLETIKDNTIRLQDTIIFKQKQQIMIAKVMIDNDLSIIRNYETLETTLKQDLKLTQKEVKRQKRLKIVGTVLGLLIGFEVDHLL